MKNLLIISFDIVKDGECESFAIGSIISSLKSNLEYGRSFNVDWLPYNLQSIDLFDLNYCLNSSLFKRKLSDYSHIAISCYVWSNDIVNPLIDKLFESGFDGKIILGGYEISYSETEDLKNLYPKANYLIKGYAEKSILDILLGKMKEGIVVSGSLDFSLLPSPYLSNTLQIVENMEKVRWETKRGCPYKCNFCAHRDLIGKKVSYHGLDKAFAELALFKVNNVRKINVLDPVFNIGKDYMKIIDEASRIGLSSKFSLQVRPEIVTDEFLDSVSNLNVCLEFGIQTFNEHENNFIKRANNFAKIAEVIRKVNERKIQYEVSLIYGLPFQTVSTFSESIDRLLELECSSITAFPLMLLKGTELFELKNDFGFREMKLGKYNIPTVVESNSFTEKDWWKMYELAEQLSPNNRIF